MPYQTPHIIVNPGDDYTNKHVVINCRTNTISACDTLEDAQSLAAEHDAEIGRNRLGVTYPPESFVVPPRSKVDK